MRDILFSTFNKDVTMSKTTIADDFITGHKGRLGSTSVVSNGDKSLYFLGKTSEQLRQLIIAEQYKQISSTFGIEEGKSEEEIKIIKDRFYELVSGSGNEWMEINQLNSSALLAFLCFHQVRPDLGKTFNIKDVGSYSDVIFEVQSPLKGKGRSRPVSNMDIVLLNGKEALFLESKFTEYLKPTNTLKVSSYYKGRYCELLGTKGDSFPLVKQDDIDINFNEDRWISADPIYLEGLKQMVCHYLGISDTLKKGVTKATHKCWKEIFSNDMKIKLGEIIFDFSQVSSQIKKQERGEESNNALNNYRKAHKALCDKLRADNEKPGNPKIEILDEILTYQDVFGVENSWTLTQTTRNFYELG